MAGTMPHAVFVETALDGGEGVAAYAAELPGCATFAASDAEAAGAIPARVTGFLSWLRHNGEQTADIPGDNWYEVERSATGDGPDGRATFSLDELPPGPDEWDRWRRWLDLAREELAEAIDAAGIEAVTGHPALAAILAQDEAMIRSLGGDPGELPDDPIDRMYAVRDALTESLDASGPSGDRVRRVLRLAIADDLRLADQLRGGSN